jgi:hypothetical protein
LTSDLSSFEDRQDEVDSKKDESSKKESKTSANDGLKLQISAEEIKRKKNATLDTNEDPKIARFKSAEVRI